MKKIVKYIILSLVIIVLVGCTEAPTDQQDTTDSEFVEYGVAGNITEISENESSETLRILVKGDEDNGATYTQAWVTINEDTKIYGQESETMDQLEVEMYVHVFFDGPVAESFPVQGTAKQVNIIEDDQLNETESDE